jgi:hypothetical protein
VRNAASIRIDLKITERRRHRDGGLVGGGCKTTVSSGPSIINKWNDSKLVQRKLCEMRQVSVL